MDVERQKKLKSTLQEVVKIGRLSHAYIFSGTATLEKVQFVKQFSAWLFATSDIHQRSENEILQRIEKNIHPDFLWIEPKENTLRVDDVRDLPRTLGYAPLESKYRIVVLQDAQRMNTASANAILKILEEPPAYVVFFLLCPDAALLLPTIASRAQKIYFPPVGDQLEELNEVQIAASDALLALWEASPKIPSQSLAFIDQAAESDLSIAQTLQTWLTLFRDFNVVLDGGQPFYHVDKADRLQNLRNKKFFSKLNFAEKSDLFFRAQKDIDFHVNAKLVLQTLLCDLQIPATVI